MTTTTDAEAGRALPEDRERMRRLSEEVQGRLREMGLIMTRNLSGWPTRRTRS